jgi:lantibiotic modifying enzyme
VLTGLAHGLAGVGFFLLQLWRVTGKRRYLDAALAAGATLSWSALPFGDQPGGVNWPMSLGASAVDASWLYWCHGATGIGLFLLALSQEEAGRHLAPLARRCAETVASVGARGGGTLCHGLAGNGLFLLRAHEVLRDERLLRRAQDMGALLRSTACPTRAGMVWPGERPGLYTPDLMVGSAGTASFFLALGGPALPGDELRLPVV